MNEQAKLFRATHTLHVLLIKTFGSNDLGIHLLSTHCHIISLRKKLFFIKPATDDGLVIHRYMYVCMCVCVCVCVCVCMYVYDVYQVNLNAPHDLHYPLCGACAMFMDLMVSLNPTTHITMYKNLIASFIV